MVITSVKQIDPEVYRLMLRRDGEYLWRIVSMWPRSAQDQIVRYYCAEFQSGMQAEPIIHKKANAGRRRANLYLTNKCMR